jgi:hypothetical protein
VASASGAAGGSGSAASDAGEGGSSELSGAAGEIIAFGGSASEGGGPSTDTGGGGSGSAGTSAAGSGGTLVSAGSSGAGGACSPVAWFPDADGDDFGRSSAQISACAAPTSGANGKWTSKGGDCNDDDPSVFPQQSGYESSGYAVGAGVSFDYDCSGQEQPDPSQLGAAPACSGLALLNCAGSGFVNTNRTGPGVNPLCGSKTLLTCAVKDALFCEGLPSQVAEGVRCH